MSFDSIIGRATADTFVKKLDRTAAKEMTAGAIRKTAIDTVDSTAFKAAANELSSEQLVSQVQASVPAWTNDNRDAFRPAVQRVLTMIKTLRGTAGDRAGVLEAASRDMAAAQGKFVGPVNTAQAAVDAATTQFRGPVDAASRFVADTDSKYRGILTQANTRLNNAKAGLRTNLRPGADAAQGQIDGALENVRNARLNAQNVAALDVNAALNTTAGANAQILDAAGRIQQGGPAMAGLADALKNSADGNLQQIGATVEATGNGIAGDAAATIENASHVTNAIQNISSVHAQMREQAAAMDQDLAFIEQALGMARGSLEAAPADDAVLAHARALAAAVNDPASQAYVNARQALINDFAGRDPMAVAGALDQAADRLRTVGQRLPALDVVSPLDRELAMIDENAGAIAQSGATMGQGAAAIRPTLGDFSQLDPSLQDVMNQIGATADGIGGDTAVVSQNASLLTTAGIRQLDDTVVQTQSAIAQGTSNIDGFVTNARNALQAPGDMQVRGSALELVSSADAAAQASTDLTTHLADANTQLTAAQATFDTNMGPTRKGLTDAKAAFDANMGPTRQAVTDAQAAVSEVKVPLGKLEEFARGIPDSVPFGVNHLHWNNPVNFFDRSKVDPSKVFAEEVQNILGGKL